MRPEKPAGPSKGKGRRTSKPLMEKKRRARINECLAQLKSLVLDATKRDASHTARYSKLEKADILEMTVRHLRNMHRQFAAVSISVDPSVLDKYRAGYSRCVSEVTKYLNSQEINASLRSKILDHMTNCVTTIPIASHTVGATSSAQMQVPPRPVTVASVPIQIAQKRLTTPEVNNNGIQIVSSLQTSMPSSVSSITLFPKNTGDITLVLPAVGATHPIPVIPVYMTPASRASTSSSGQPTATQSVPCTTVCLTQGGQPGPSSQRPQPPAAHRVGKGNHVSNIGFQARGQEQNDPANQIRCSNNSGVWRPW